LELPILSKVTNTKFSGETQWLFCLFAAALFLWLVGLGDLPLRDWDEGYYGTVARDMYRTDNWLYPSYLGEPFLLKPPLTIWLIALSYHWGGISEWTSRFPCAFLSAFGVILLYLLAKEAFESKLPAIFSALVYLTLLPAVRHGRLAMLDGMINSFFLLSLWCLLKSRQQRRWAVGFGIGLGLIALTKGILVLALGTIAVIFLLVNRQENVLKNPYFWLGITIGAVPTLGWYLAQFVKYGNTFIQIHFQSQSFERLSTAVEGNSGPIWYYLVELLKYGFPWVIFFPSGLILAWKNRRQTWANLILIGGISYLGLISVMGTKLPWYIMPFYPFFALAVGAYLAKLWRWERQYPKIFAVIFVVLSAVALGGGIYFFWTKSPTILIILAAVLCITLAVTAWQFYQSQPLAILILITGLYTALALLMISPVWVWELNEAFPVKPVAALINAKTPPDAEIYSFLGYRPSLDFYSDRRVIAANVVTLKELGSEPFYWLLRRKDLEKVSWTNPIDLGSTGDFILIRAQPDIK
jgi:4-amino-4-deoxy-L-arabinose transferase-like glycosyltransferase